MPEHLEQVFTASKEHLTEQESAQLADLLNEYQDVFAKTEYDLGHFSGIEHAIDTGQARPIKQRMRRTPACFAGEEEAHLKKMLEAGVIQESTSEWASAPVLIRKRDGSVRWCIDYRALNDVTVKDVYPLPLVDDCLDTLAGSVWFSKLDANSAYWQVKIREEDRKKTAFITRYGLFEHIKMGFGLCNGPASYARVMNLVLRGLNWKTVLAFLDDVLVLGHTFQNHLNNLADALTRFREHGLKLKPKKCLFFQKEVEFLGRRVSNNRIAMSDVDILTVRNWPIPTCSKDVERFAGLANYHRGFVKDFSRLAAPLYQVVGKHKFYWGPAQEHAFAALKDALTNPPILGLPNRTDAFVLDTDASDFAIGAELLQIQDGKEKVIAYGSYSLTTDQRKYCATRKELLAVVRFTRQFRHYLLGKPFMVRTDHSSLTWLMRFHEPQGQLARWLEELSQYNMVLRHREGRKHTNADSLSRMPASEGQCPAFERGVRPEDLPCGGCRYCVKADQSWGAFTEAVDEAVPPSSQSVLGIVDDDGHIISVDSTRGRIGRRDVSVVEENAERQVSDNGKTVQAVELDLATPCLRVEAACEGGSDVAHVDIIFSGEEVHVLSVENRKEVEAKSVDKPSSWGFSLEELKEAQGKDDTLSFILQWLNHSVNPGESELFIASPAAKSYWLNKEQFVLIDGVLYQNEVMSGDKKLVIPKELRELAVKWNHDLPSAGHQGVARTKERVKEKFTWFGLSTFVSQYVAGCEVCNKCKKSDRKGRCPLTEYQAGAPMERVHLDFLGPLPKTQNGNEYILMMVDQFTKWVECIPLPTQTAEETARAAVDNFFSRFGFPFQVFSDQGRNFESKLFVELCKALQIHKARTTPYRPSSNGQVERYNRTLMDAVRCFIGKKQDQWDRHLQQLAGALRASVNRQTGFTANKLMFGREVNMPAHLMFPHAGDKSRNTSEYIGGLTSSS
ncbi:MAG: RNase H-like domain-containing protein [Candidatus Thiodiazotropha endolucinida]|nr:RNase H-like domain-containing protein [Candidatus Thiodiazotropha endolucinida]